MKAEEIDRGEYELQKWNDICTYLYGHLGIYAHLLGCAESGQLAGCYILQDRSDDIELFGDPVISDKKHQENVRTDV